MDIPVCTAGPSMTHRSGEAALWQTRMWCGACRTMSYCEAGGKLGCFCQDSKIRWRPCSQAVNEEDR